MKLYKIILLLLLSGSAMAQTVDLSTKVNPASAPAGTVVQWHSSATPSAATVLPSTTVTATTTPTNYWVFFFDGTFNCYSPGSKVVVVRNTAPAQTVNLGSISSTAPPAGSSIVWFTTPNRTAGTEVAAPNAVAAGTYWPFFYNPLAGGCYSPAGTPVIVAILNCNATDVPYITGTNFEVNSKTYSIPCGSTTANLNTLTASNSSDPATIILTWHTATPATTANKIADVSALTGTQKLYAAFWDSAANCYSPTQKVIVFAPICAVDDDFTSTPIIYGEGGTLGSIFANDTFNGNIIANLPPPAVDFLESVWVTSNAQVDTLNAATYGRLTIPPTTLPGTYEYSYQITDRSPDGISNFDTATVRFRVVSCTNTPTGGTPDSYTQTGISSLEGFGNGWPNNVPNGFIAIESKKQGFVITRVANTGLITSPTEGMLVYDLSNSPPCVKLYNGSSWNCLAKDCN